MRIAVLLVLILFAVPGVARADWSGDGPGDVLTVHPDGSLLLYRGNGAGGWLTGKGESLGGGWSAMTALMAPGDFSGDGKPDLLARDKDGRLLMYRGDGAGGWAGTPQVVGSGWGPFTAVFSPGDFTGDGHPDVLARNADGALLLYRGDGDGGWVTGKAEPIGSGWGPFQAVLPAGDFSGDGKPDVFAVATDGTLYLYRGNGAGGWETGKGEPVGSGWAGFTALATGGDFNGDGKADALARTTDGSLYLYRGTGASGWVDNGTKIGSGWNSLAHITLAPSSPPPPPPPAPPPPPPAPAAPLPDGNVALNAGIRCTPPGGLLRVSVKVRKRAGKAAPRVSKILFYVHNGPRRTDRHRPYTVRLRLHRPAGQKGRVYARVYFRRTGSKKLHTKTVSRRFVMCG
ncbi:FG-GAP-like repeat-containing protein [Solirubrobacter soli]|uniref:FG-GAP-like repeat-containing protein n=1 Tax=Solirubrobacter soli TaxID=363832 RepID=UPI0004097BE2|nr:FG-GAP-like repeat-containing protein [Solirubrobacter soli]